MALSRVGSRLLRPVLLRLDPSGELLARWGRRISRLIVLVSMLVGLLLLGGATLLTWYEQDAGAYVWQWARGVLRDPAALGWALAELLGEVLVTAAIYAVLSRLARAVIDGIGRIIVTHPLLKEVGMSVEMQKEAAEMGALLEYPFNAILPSNPVWGGGSSSLEEYVKAIRAVGPEHCVLSSDLGQPMNPVHTDGLIAFFEQLKGKGFTPAEMTGIALISSMPGVIAHISEELETKTRIRIVPDEIASYPRERRDLEGDLAAAGW